MLLDRGEELSPNTAPSVRTASATLLMRLLDDSPPLREGQIIRVSPSRAGDGRGRGIVLCQRDGEFRLSSARTPSAIDTLGRVVAIQRGPAIFPIDRGLLALLPRPWLGGIVDALEVLLRFCHPLHPPLSFPSRHESLAAVRDKYGRAGEVGRYSHLAMAATEAFELDLVARHVRRGGSILDIGCGPA
jgi:hypothetical protein